MKLAVQEHTDLSMGVLQEHAFSFEMNGIAAYTLMSGIAKDKIGYPIRELSTNAWDAAKGNFEVFLPTRFRPVFRVRDYGPGLSPAAMESVYTRFFASTKRGTNDEVGGLGLGCKSPFAYLIIVDDNGSRAASYTVRSFHGGRVRTYTMALAHDGLPTMKLLDDSETEEPTGLDISFGVRSEDISAFHQKAREILWSFEPRPRVFPEIDWGTGTVVFQGPGWTKYDEVPWSGPHVRMGCVMYPIDTNVVDHSGFLTYRDPVLFDAPIGSLTVQTSRENLGYDDRTKGTLAKLIAAYEQTLIDAIQAEVDKATTYFEACRRFSDVTLMSRWKQQRIASRVSWKGFDVHTVIPFKNMLLSKDWTGFQRFDGEGNINPLNLENRRIVVEHNPHRSLERFQALGLVGEEIAWFRIKKVDLPSFLTATNLTEQDITVLDSAKLPTVGRSRGNLRSRQVLQVVGGRVLKAVAQVDLDAGGVFVTPWRTSYKRRGVDGYDIPHRLSVSALDDVLRESFQLQVLESSLTILIRKDNEELDEENWYPLGDYLDLRLRDVFDPSQVVNACVESEYDLPGCIRDFGRKFVFDQAPQDLKDLKVRAEVITNSVGTSHTPGFHDRIARLLTRISDDGHPVVDKTPIIQLEKEIDDAYDRYPLLKTILDDRRYNSSHPSTTHLLNHYFELLGK